MTVDVVQLLLIPPLAIAHGTFWGILLSNLVYLHRQESSRPDRLPTLSVCIPARNEAKNLRRLLPTLRNQEYPELEILIWDDGSEDETWDVLTNTEASRLIPLRGSDPPPDWIGKVHALYQCTRRASGECYLFLDADAELRRPDALKQLVYRHLNSSTRLSSGFPKLTGSALLLVSLVPHALLSSLPWPLVPRTRMSGLSALNGQCWLINSDAYHTHEPHAQVKDAVLEDVAIGRYLKEQGLPPTLLDVKDLIAIHMYDGFGAAWRGFRKNAYLLLGGTLPQFLFMYSGFVLCWLVAPLLSLWFLVSLYGLKIVTDRASGMPPLVSALAPLTFLLAIVLQLDSAVHHWRDHVRWKGRSVPSSSRSETSPEKTEELSDPAGRQESF